MISATPTSTSSDATTEGASREVRRHVIYLPGFDPRRPEAYRGLMERELTQHTQMRGITSKISRRVQRLGKERIFARWHLESCDQGTTVKTELTFFGWRDIAAQNFAMSTPLRIRRAFETFADLTFNGFYRRQWRQNRGRTMICLYPFIGLVLLLVLSAIPAVLALRNLLAGNWIDTALIGAAAVIWPWLLFRIVRFAEPLSYFWYIVNDMIAIRSLGLDRDPLMTERIETFAERTIALEAAAGLDDEFIFIGHSSGASVAIYTLGRVLALNPAFGRNRRCKPVLLTLGASHGFFGHLKRTPRLHEALSRLARARHVDWIDVYAPQDILCAGRLDPVRAFAANTECKGRGGPIMQSACVPDALPTDVYRRIKRSFFHFHFCYLHAIKPVSEFGFYTVLVGVKPWSWVKAKSFRAAKPAKPKP